MNKLAIPILFMIFALPLGLAYGSSPSDELIKFEIGFEEGNGFVYYADGTKDKNNVFTHLGEGIPEGFSNNDRETNSNIYRYKVAFQSECDTEGKEITPRTYQYESFLFQRLGIMKTQNQNQSRGYYWGSDWENDSEGSGKIGFNDEGNPIIISRTNDDAFYFLGSCITPANYTLGEVLIKGFSSAGDALFELLLSIELIVGKSPTYYDMSEEFYEGTPISEFKIFSLEISSQDFSSQIAEGNTGYQFVLDRLTFGIEEGEGGTYTPPEPEEPEEPEPTPEPATFLILGSCIAALPILGRRRRQS